MTPRIVTVFLGDGPTRELTPSQCANVIEAIDERMVRVLDEICTRDGDNNHLASLCREFNDLNVVRALLSAVLE